MSQIKTIERKEIEWRREREKENEMSHLALMLETHTFKWHRRYYIWLTLLHLYFWGEYGSVQTLFYPIYFYPCYKWTNILTFKRPRHLIHSEGHLLLVLKMIPHRRFSTQLLMRAALAGPRVSRISEGCGCLCSPAAAPLLAKASHLNKKSAL